MLVFLFTGHIVQHSGQCTHFVYFCWQQQSRSCAQFKCNQARHNLNFSSPKSCWRKWVESILGPILLARLWHFSTTGGSQPCSAISDKKCRLRKNEATGNKLCKFFTYSFKDRYLQVTCRTISKPTQFGNSYNARKQFFCMVLSIPPCTKWSYVGRIHFAVNSSEGTNHHQCSGRSLSWQSANTTA